MNYKRFNCRQLNDVSWPLRHLIYYLGRVERQGWTLFQAMCLALRFNGGFNGGGICIEKDIKIKGQNRSVGSFING